MQRWIPAIFVLAFVPFHARLQADDEPGRGEKLFEAALVPVAVSSAQQLGALYSPNAKDRLLRGSVEVRRKHEVEIRLEGASPSQTYQVLFCTPGLPCQPLGQIATDRDGDARERLPFLLAGTDFSGVFVLAREGVGQFVSGWRFPEPAPVAATTTEVRLSGEVAFVGGNFLRLRGLPLDIVVTPETRFERVGGLSELRPGDDVEIEAYVRADGILIAVRVRLAEKPAPAGPKAR